MFHSLEKAIGEIKGSDRRIAARRSVSGGDINDAFLLTPDDGEEIFMKANAVAMLPAFEAEEQGLLAIAQTGTIGTAEVLGIGTDPDGFSFLLQEPIHSGHRIREYWETLGEELRSMHAAPVPEDFRHCFGFPTDNFIGAGKQINAPHSSWIDFYRECRLTPQLRTAEKYLDKKDRDRASWILEHLDRYLAEPAAPSLIHGDLWAGNVMTGPDGKAWIIDPAAYYGHPEADIAMTELFGGFAPVFYETYFACADLTPGYQDRKDLYNLYHLLNHLNLFGIGYLSQVRRILHRYGG